MRPRAPRNRVAQGWGLWFPNTPVTHALEQPTAQAGDASPSPHSPHLVDDAAYHLYPALQSVWVALDRLDVLQVEMDVRSARRP